MNFTCADSKESEKKAKIIYEETTAKDILGGLLGLIILVVCSVVLFFIGYWAVNLSYERAPVPGEVFRFSPVLFIMGIVCIGSGIGLPIYAIVTWLKSKSERQKISSGD